MFPPGRRPAAHKPEPGTETCTTGKIAQSADLPEPEGLRARKKQETRKALAAAAMRLALRDGLDRLRIEDIAAEANVSVRTFRNYFGSKADALTSYHATRMSSAAADLRARPPQEGLWDAVVGAILTPWCGGARGHLAPDPSSIAELRLMFDVPAVQAGIIRASLEPGNPFAMAVAERTGTDAAADLYPRLVAAAVAAAMQVAVDVFLKSDPPQPLVPVVREALALLSAGLPDPSAPRGKPAAPGCGGTAPDAAKRCRPSRVPLTCGAPAVTSEGEDKPTG